jgi:two-component sensor histidine kinase
MEIGDLVRMKGVPSGGGGVVIGFSEVQGQRLVLVEWTDGRGFPNPTIERESNLAIIPPAT